MRGGEEMEQGAVVNRIMERAKAVLEWSQAHPGSTLRELEEQVQKAVQAIRVELMEAAVAQQGVGAPPEASCSCGGAWVFKGYKTRQVTTTQGSIRIRRAYYVCDRCGAGFFPPGRPIGEPGGME